MDNNDNNTIKIINAINKKQSHLQAENQRISGPIYFRIWLHLFDFKSKQNRKSALIDLAIHYSIMIGLMFFYRWITTFFVGIQVCILWLIFYLIAQTIPLSTFARRIRSADYSWWFCFFIFIPVLRALPYFIILLSEDSKTIMWSSLDVPAKESEKTIKISLILIIVLWGILCVISFPIRFLLLDGFFGNIVVDYSTNVNEYEYYLNKVTYANEHLPETIDSFGNPKEIMFGYKKVSVLRFLNFKYEGISLFASYGDEYFTEKEKILSTYEFASYEEVKSAIGFDTFNYRDYEYHIGKNTSERFSGYSHEICMIGFDDSNKYISYLYFYDFDLDSVTYHKHTDEERLKELYDFMDESFVWRTF